MEQLQQLKQRLDAQTTALAAFKLAVTSSLTAIQGDVQNLKAQIEALVAQVPNSAEVDAVMASMNSLEVSTAALSDVQSQAETLDAATPPIPPPGPPA